MKNKKFLGQLKYLLGKVIFPGLFQLVVIVEFTAVITCSFRCSKHAHILPTYVSSYLYIHVCGCIYIPTYVHTHTGTGTHKEHRSLFSAFSFCKGYYLYHKIKISYDEHTTTQDHMNERYNSQFKLLSRWETLCPPSPSTPGKSFPDQLAWAVQGEAHIPLQLTTRPNAHRSNLSGQRVDRPSTGENNPPYYPFALKTGWQELPQAGMEGDCCGNHARIKSTFSWGFRDKKKKTNKTHCPINPNTLSGIKSLKRKNPHGLLSLSTSMSTLYSPSNECISS